MQSVLAATLLVAALALAGCSGGKEGPRFEDVTCPDGTILTSKDIEANESSGEDGFDPTSLCPVAPKVLLTGLPATLGAYRSASFTWVVDPGSVTKGHSMLTSIRFSETSVPAPAAMDAYPTEVIKKEHQDLPVTFKGNLSFTQPGKVYVRAYAQVQGEGYDRRDVWSDEVPLEILPVAPTGVVHTVTHGPGPAPVGALDTTDLDAKLGDALAFANEDLAPHTLTLTQGPPGAPAATLEADGQYVFVVPGSYSFETDDVQKQTLDVSVSL